MTGHIRTVTFCFVGIIVLLINIYVFEEEVATKTQWVVQKLRPNQTLNSNQSHDQRVCTNQARIAYVEHKCQSKATPVDHNSRFLRFIVDEKRKLVYCEISKAGCTTVKAFWEFANNSSMRIATNPHEIDRLQYGGIKFVNEYHARFRNYRSFLVVRHPFSRLLSAFHNLKMKKSGQPGPALAIADDITKTFNLKNWTLVHFLLYITNPKSKFYNDRHWIPYVDSCLICDLKYEQIFRIETMESDAKRFMRLFPSGSHFELPHLNVHGDGDSREIDGTLEEFEGISNDILAKLMDRYRDDMDLFGYTFDIHTFQASCDMKGCC